MSQPTLTTQLTHYIQDALWQLQSCLNCFPSNPTLKINAHPYKILRLLGEGGFSYVYLVQSPSSPTLYALKKIRCPFGEESIAHALREVEAYRMFGGAEGVIAVVDSAVVRDEGVVYVLLPYFRRGNLQDAVNANLVNRVRFPEGRLVGLFLGVCRALRVMHRYRVKGGSGAKAGGGKGKGEGKGKGRRRDEPAGSEEAAEGGEGDALMEGEGLAAQDGAEEGELRAYAHRDIKPGNIMIDDTGTQPVLMDLGSMAPSPTPITSRALALQVQDQAAEHSTMPYRAPELFDVKTGTVVDTKVDIWSLGCTLYACLVGKSPFEARSEETGGSLSLCVMGGDWRFPDEGPAEARRGKQKVVQEAEAEGRRKKETISEPVKDIVRKCLRVEPADRPDIDQLIAMVEEVVTQLPDDGEASWDSD